MNIMSLPEIMDGAIDSLRKYIKSVITFTIGYNIILFLIMIPVIIVVGIIAAVFIAATATTGVSPVFITIVIVIIMPVFIGMAMSQYTGLIKIAAQDYTGDNIFASNAIKASLGSIFKVTGILSIAVIIFLPILAAFVLVGYLLYKQFAATEILLGIFGNREIILIVLSAAAILIALAVISLYSNAYVFALQAAIIEKLGVFDSIKRSFNLVKKNFWKVFGYMLLFQLAVTAISFSLESIIGIIIGLIYLILELMNLHQDYAVFLTMAYSYARWPINLISWIFGSPFWVMMTTKLYYNIRFQREGYDMVLKLQEIRNSKMKESIQ